MTVQWSQTDASIFQIPYRGVSNPGHELCSRETVPAVAQVCTRRNLGEVKGSWGHMRVGGEYCRVL